MSERTIKGLEPTFAAHLNFTWYQGHSVWKLSLNGKVPALDFATREEAEDWLKCWRLMNGFTEDGKYRYV